MVLQTSGQISLNEINIEARGSQVSGTEVSINELDTRELIGKGQGAAGGAIQMAFSEWYGAARAFALNLASNVKEADIHTLATNAGWNGSDKVNVTVGAGVYVWSDNISTAAMTISGSFPNGVEVNNSGFIIGRGGNLNGATGGSAISNSVSNVTITNTGYIAGGGGGGGSAIGGGGAGGGAGSGAGGQPGSNGNNSVSTAHASVSHPTTLEYCGGECDNNDTDCPTGSCTGTGSVSITPTSGGTDTRPGGATGQTVNVPVSTQCYAPACAGGGPASGGANFNVSASVGGGGGSRRLASTNLDGHGSFGGGGWGRSGLGSGAGAPGPAINSTVSYVLTDNGTIYGGV